MIEKVVHWNNYIYIVETASLISALVETERLRENEMSDSAKSHVRGSTYLCKSKGDGQSDIQYI